MPAPRRVLLVAIAVLAAGGVIAWLGTGLVGKTGRRSPAARGPAALQTSTVPHTALPAPGSAVEFDSLLALARADLAAFTDWLARHAAALSPEQRLLFLRELMRRWLAEWQAGAPGGIRDAFLRLASTSPETAGRLVGLLPSVPLRHLLVEELIAAWASADPDAAERWIVALPQGIDRGRGFTALAEARLRRDPAAAMAWASAQLESPPNPAIVQDFTLGFAAADPARAAEWTATLPDGPLKHQATAVLAATWADGDVAKASQWVASLPPGDARNDAITATAQVWSSAAPEEAARWFGAQSFTTPEARSSAYRDFSEALTVADPEAGRRWIDSLADPALADPALAGAADATYDESPEQALLMAMKIKDPVTRAVTLGELMSVWREDDPEAAEKFAATHLPPSKPKPAR